MIVFDSPVPEKPKQEYEKRYSSLIDLFYNNCSFLISFLLLYIKNHRMPLLIPTFLFDYQKHNSPTYEVHNP